MKSFRFALGLAAALITPTAYAKEGFSAVTGIPALNHVYLIMMENHGYGQILTNPNAPFTNAWAAKANLATNYFGVGHPSSTNYLEIVGGSNFGDRSDHYPDFHSKTCQTNLSTGQPNLDNPAPTNPNVCPIAGTGTDAATPAVDCSNEYTSPKCGNDIDGVKAYKAATDIVGKSIADQLVSRGKSWKSYQENLPVAGPDLINYSDGLYSNLTDFTKINPQLTPPLTSSEIVYLYAAKHNPFVYFASVQGGNTPALSYKQVVGFDGPRGLLADLAAGHSPNFSFIVPNQCNDMHGRGNAGAFCNYDPTSNGTQAGLNPALIQLGDLALSKIVTAIKASPEWSVGDNAIVAVWDENDYSIQPNINQVPVIVDTNYGVHKARSAKYYNHFSLLKTLEGAFDLPCLNHACDADQNVMADLFKKK